MMARRNFLLALLAATFMCIVVLQISLDGWVLRGTVHYTVSVEKKDQIDTSFKAEALRHDRMEPLSQNSYSSSSVLEPKRLSPISIQLPLAESVSTTSGSLLGPGSLFAASENSSLPQPASSDLPNLQMVLSNFSNVVPPGLVSSSNVHVSPSEAATVIPSNLPGQNSKLVAPSFLTQVPVLPTITKSVIRPHPTSSNSNISQILPSTTRKPSKQLHLTVPSEVKPESKSIEDVQQPTDTDPKYRSQQGLQKSNEVQARIKVRSFEQPMKSRGILQRKQPPEYVNPQERLREILKQSNSIHVRSRADPLRVLRPVPTVNPNNVTHIILVTYFRSGSTFVGDLLQQNWKTFYHFEPLHFMTYDSRIGGSKVQEAFDLFSSILRCNFSNVESYLKWAKKPDNQFLFARNVFLWFSCKSSPRMCFTPEMVSAVCQRAPVQVMKITRLHMRDLREFLSQNPDIKAKVVYLTRDPRGIISSRKTLDWCSDTQCSDPHFLCTEMIDDLRVFNELRGKQPERFIQVRYEDIALNPEKEAKRLFELLGLSFTLSVQRFLKTHTTARKADNLDPYSTRRNSSSMAFSWRSRLTFAQISSIQDACSEVIHQLNGTLITSPGELYNLTGTNSSAGTNNSDFIASNFKRLGLRFHSRNYTNNEAINSTSNAEVIGKGVKISNYAENNVSADAKGRVIFSGRSAHEMKNVRNSFENVYSTSLHSNSSSEVRQLQIRMGSLHTRKNT